MASGQRWSGERLLGELGPTLVGKAVMSGYSAQFYAEDETTLYVDVLERAAPLRKGPSGDAPDRGSES